MSQFLLSAHRKALSSSCLLRSPWIGISTKAIASVKLSTWGFPQPDPPPSPEDVEQEGLPLLRKVVEHAHRPFVTEYPECNVGKDTTELGSGQHALPPRRPQLSYLQVIGKAAQVSKYITQRQQSSSVLVAHSTIPGSDYIACQWGAFAAKKASVPLSTTARVPELEHVLQDSQPSVILVSTKAPNQAQVLEAAANCNLSDRIVFLEDILCNHDDETSLNTQFDPQELLDISTTAKPSLDQAALLLYTSGTTGKPKGVLHTHRNLYHQITDLVAAWEWQSTDVAVHVLPLHHVHGVVNILSCAAYAGAQLHFQPFDPYELWKQWAHAQPPHNVGGKHNNQLYSDHETVNLNDEASRLARPTVFMAVPTIYAKLLEAARNSPPDLIQEAIERTLHPMRLMVSGSAALPPPIFNEWQQLTKHTLLERYGMTEFAMALSNPYNEIAAPRQPGYVGVPLPSVQVRLVDTQTGTVLLEETQSSTPRNNVMDSPISGALQVKGPTVFREYLNRPDATLEAFTEDGYFDTGDVAEYDPEVESYRILGRESVDIMKVGGNKISALEIERTFMEHPDVAEVAIVGVPDTTWGQRVGMIGRCRSNAPPSLENLQLWCETKMEKHKTPTRILWVDDIPKNAMGKVNKKELVQLFLTD